MAAVDHHYHLHQSQKKSKAISSSQNCETIAPPIDAVEVKIIPPKKSILMVPLALAVCVIKMWLIFLNFFKDCIDNTVSYLKCFELLWLGRWADAWWVWQQIKFPISNFPQSSTRVSQEGLSKFVKYKHQSSFISKANIDHNTEFQYWNIELMEAKLAQGSLFASIHFHKSLGLKFPYNSKQKFGTERTLLQQDKKLINVIKSQ